MSKLCSILRGIVAFPIAILYWLALVILVLVLNAWEWITRGTIND